MTYNFTDSSRKPLEDYSVDELAKYFKQVGMEKYVKCIKEHEINGEDISSMTLSDLEKEGIDDLLDRLKICMFISQLKNNKPEALTPEAISTFLQEYQLEKYMFAFEQHDRDCSSETITVLDSCRIIAYYRKHLGEHYDHQQSKIKLVEILKDLKMKSEDEHECIKTFMENDVSLYMLKEGDKKLLYELGFTNRLIRKLKF